MTTHVAIAAVPDGPAVAAASRMPDVVAVVSALVQNALDAGALRVRAELAAGGHDITVHDDGCGFDDAVLLSHTDAGERGTERVWRTAGGGAVTTHAAWGRSGRALRDIALCCSRLSITSNPAGGSTAVACHGLFAWLPVRREGMAAAAAAAPATAWSRLTGCLATFALLHPRCAFTLVKQPGAGRVPQVLLSWPACATFQARAAQVLPHAAGSSERWVAVASRSETAGLRGVGHLRLTPHASLPATSVTTPGPFVTAWNGRPMVRSREWMTPVVAGALPRLLPSWTLVGWVVAMTGAPTDAAMEWLPHRTVCTWRTPAALDDLSASLTAGAAEPPSTPPQPLPSAGTMVHAHAVVDRRRAALPARGGTCSVSTAAWEWRARQQSSVGSIGSGLLAATFAAAAARRYAVDSPSAPGSVSASADSSAARATMDAPDGVMTRRGPERAAGVHITRAIIATARVVGQVDRRFIALACAAGRHVPGADAGGMHLLLVDQHAAHERIRLEQLEDALFGGGLVQLLGMTPDGLHWDDGVSVERGPVRLAGAHPAEARAVMAAFHDRHLTAAPTVDPRPQIAVHAGDAVALRACEHVLEAWGIATAWCSGVLKLRSLPVLFAQPAALADVAEYVAALASAVGNGRAMPSVGLSPLDVRLATYRAGLAPRFVTRTLHSRACRGAIMFGRALSHAECGRMVTALQATRLPFQCAHGRPAIVPLTTLVPRA